MEKQQFKQSLHFIFFYAFVGILILFSVGYVSFKLNDLYPEELETASTLLWRMSFLFVFSWIGYLVIKRNTTKYIITSDNISSESGIFLKTIIKVPLHRISDYKIDSSLVERLIGVSNIMIDTSGGSAGYELTMHDLENKDVDIIVAKLDMHLKKQVANDEDVGNF